VSISSAEVSRGVFSFEGSPHKTGKGNMSLLTVRGVAGYLGISRATVYRLIRRGEIPHIKKGFGYRFRKTDLDEWLYEARRKPLFSEVILRKLLTSPMYSDNENEGGKMATVKKGRRHFAYGSIYQRKKGGSWTIDYRDAQGRRIQRVAKGALTATEAHEALKRSVFEAFFSKKVPGKKSHLKPSLSSTSMTMPKLISAHGEMMKAD